MKFTVVRCLCRLRGTSLSLDVAHGLVDLGVLRVAVNHLIANKRKDRIMIWSALIWQFIYLALHDTKLQILL